MVSHSKQRKSLNGSLTPHVNISSTPLSFNCIIVPPSSLESYLSTPLNSTESSGGRKLPEERNKTKNIESYAEEAPSRVSLSILDTLDPLQFGKSPFHSTGSCINDSSISNVSKSWFLFRKDSYSSFPIYFRNDVSDATELRYEQISLNERMFLLSLLHKERMDRAQEHEQLVQKAQEKHVAMMLESEDLRDNIGTLRATEVMYKKEIDSLQKKLREANEMSNMSTMQWREALKEIEKSWKDKYEKLEAKMVLPTKD